MHRDIKPSNIISRQGSRTPDIGLVAATDDTRSFVGTEGYIPARRSRGPRRGRLQPVARSERTALPKRGDPSRATLLKKGLDIRRVGDQPCERDLANAPHTARTAPGSAGGNVP